ncbi:MAG: NUDIX hydrolase [Candidatus Eisenbacteria bacterium]
MSPAREPARYCPRCATPLEPRLEHGTMRPTCPACGYIHYYNPVPAAGVILAEAGQVLLVKRRFEPRAGTWCLPAGFMESGETPEQTAVRETEEETGLTVSLTGLFGVYAGFDDPRVRAILILYTAARSGGELRPGDDAVEAKFFPLVRLPRLLAFAAHRRALEEFRERMEPSPPLPRMKRRDAGRVAPRRARSKR